MSRYLLQSHLSILEFSKQKQVYPTSVYSAIKAGKIKPDFVGQGCIKMIDLDKYRDYKFGIHNYDKTALNNWFESITPQSKKQKPTTQNKKS
ncbi:hypothetical protein B0I18_107259 [Taibaiella chishuiensis]|uniref:Uncharacterized protein n=1 Tax=Taibaiella chishuiensis TaxID=1434707 RepID=A0A2P8D0W7_9BACT|nr:hypothetical protein B0I18_107259 [Taibaiella chishuiensis]